MSNKLDYKICYKRNLPHLQPEDAILFVTYRLAFTLPYEILNLLIAKRNEYDKKLIKLDPIERKKEEATINKVLFEIEDEFLDNYHSGPVWLGDDDVAKIVIDSLLFNHNKLYDLHFCMLMSNHVHIVIKPLKDMNGKPFSLAKIMKEHKSFTATCANKVLQRNGQFWHHENYDHCIRNEDDYYRIKHYILNNPVKAGLVDNYKNWKHYLITDNAMYHKPPVCDK